MEKIENFSRDRIEKVRYVLTDIDDTLTIEGRMPAHAFRAMELLRENGIKVIPITGRPAGWCDHIARMWPVDGLVGENGAFYFMYDEENKRMIRRYWKTVEERVEDRKNLDKIEVEVLAKIKGCTVASDQAYREADLAIDFAEDVEPLPIEAVDEIVKCFEDAGAQAKISSIHVNGWFGDYDKLKMTKIMFSEVYGLDLDKDRDQVIFSGDSPNDSPMFAYFPNGVGVANVLELKDRMDPLPAYITKGMGGDGFSEMVKHLLSK